VVTVCIFAGGAAERTGERRPPAESGDRDCGIGGAATTKKLCAAALVSGSGKRSTRNTSSSTMMPAHNMMGTWASVHALAGVNPFLHSCLQRASVFWRSLTTTPARAAEPP
jgi:hypothetical protein